MPHRLELVRELNGVRWYDDSIATTPERVSAAVDAFSEPVVLLLGGRDKDLPWGELAELICRRVDHVVLFGEAAAKIKQALTTRGAAQAQMRPTAKTAAHIRQAVSMAHKAARGRHRASLPRRDKLRRIQGL
jgi:UDP-N-acetylmuramoylalanine--D-glutamate ligase